MIYRTTSLLLHFYSPFQQSLVCVCRGSPVVPWASTASLRLSVLCLTTWLSVRVLNSVTHCSQHYRLDGSATTFLSHPKVQTGSRTQPASYVIGTGVLNRGDSRWGKLLTIHLHLAPRRRMSGATTLLPLMPSWCGQDKLHHFTALCTAHVCNINTEGHKCTAFKRPPLWFSAAQLWPNTDDGEWHSVTHSTVSLQSSLPSKRDSSLRLTVSVIGFGP